MLNASVVNFTKSCKEIFIEISIEPAEFVWIMENATSNDTDLKVYFAKSRSPTRRPTEEAYGPTEDVFQPLVAGDEFEDEEFEGNAEIFCFDTES